MIVLLSAAGYLRFLSPDIDSKSILHTNMRKFNGPVTPVPPPPPAFQVHPTAQDDDQLSDWELPEPEEQPQPFNHEKHGEMLGKLKGQVDRIELVLPHIAKRFENKEMDPEALAFLQFQRDVADMKWILDDLHSLAVTGVAGLEAPKLDNRLQSVEKSVKALESTQANPEFLEAVQKDIGALAGKLEEWQSSVGELPEWQAKLEKDINEDVGRIGLKVKEMQYLLHQSPVIKKIMTGKDFGQVLQGYENQLGANANTLKSHASHLNKVDTQLGAIREYHKNVEDAVTGTHENQVKLLKQLENVKKTQSILGASLGIVGLSALGYFGWNGISAVIKWFRSRKAKKFASAPKDFPEMAQVGHGNIKKRSHAREFKVEEGLYVRAHFE